MLFPLSLHLRSSAIMHIRSIVPRWCFLQRAAGCQARGWLIADPLRRHICTRRHHYDLVGSGHCPSQHYTYRSWQTVRGSSQVYTHIFT